MTAEQKQLIREMRIQGTTYSQIADSLGLSVNTVKSFCRRNSISVYNASKETENKDNKEQCKYCGKLLEKKPKSKPKIFCCDQCRYAWWSAHRNLLHRKAVSHLSCANCSKPFDSYGNQSRKYCCHACYIEARFGNGAHL